MQPETGKKLGIMQPYFFPYPGYFQLLHAVDTMVFYDDVNFIKNGWINRNRLLLDGAPAYFTAPLDNASPFDKIDEIRLSADTRWREKLTRKIHHAYARAPYYAQVAPLVAAVLESETGMAGELAKRSITAVAEYLSLPCRFVASSRSFGNQSLKGEARVLDICRLERATVYVNLPGGRHLYAPERFAAADTRLAFITPAIPAYPQFAAAHVNQLSIIDLLMFNSRERARELISHYEVAFPAAAGHVTAAPLDAGSTG